jgi:hypothetical protein
MFAQELAVEFVIAVAEEGLLPPVAALGDMVWQAGENGSGKAGHWGSSSFDPARAG